jgi:hypothetical protein
MKYLFFLIFLVLSINSLKAQFGMDGEFRTRSMYNRGFIALPSVNSDPAFHISQRTRMNFSYKYELLETRISIADARVWGDDNNYMVTGPMGNTNSMFIYESWVKLNLKDFLSLKIGRQNWNYDDGRILHNRNWLQTGMTYDGILTALKLEKAKIDIGISINNNNENIFGNDYREIIDYSVNDSTGIMTPIYDAKKLKTLNFLHYKYPFTKNLYMSYIAVLSGAQNLNSSSEIFYKLTQGLNMFYSSDRAFGHLSGYFQMGNNQNGQEVVAFLASAELGVKTNTNLSFAIGTDFISGNNYENSSYDYSSVNHNFDLLYGARFKFYGNLNHFTLIDRHTNNAGLIDIYLKTTYNPGQNTKLELNYHYFQSMFRAVNPEGGFYDSYLSSEVNFGITHRFSKEVSIKFGFAYALPTVDFGKIKGVESDLANPYSSYIMLIVKPKFLN